jgi:hypothetical protein
VEARPIESARGELLQEVLVGEPVFVRYDLYRRQGVLRGVYQSNEPQFTKFWPYDASDVIQHLPFGAGPKQRSGVQYEREPLVAYVLVPLEVGEQVISPVEVQVHHGAGRTAQWIASPEVTLKVAPLPPGAPPGFDARNVGSILSLNDDEEGRTFLAAAPDMMALRKGDSVTLSLQLVGLGAVSHMRLPPLPDAPGMHIAPPEVVSSRDEVIRVMLRGEKLFRVQVTALEEGELEIPAASFTYFDTDDRHYKTLTAGPWRIKVEGESPNFEAVKRALESKASGGLDLGAGLPGLRAVTLRAGLDALAAKAPAYSRPWFWALLGLAPALFVGLWLRDLWRARASAAAPTRGAKRAAADARKALKALADRADPARAQDLYAGIDQIAQTYIDARFSLKTRGMTTADLAQALARVASPQAADALVQALGEARRMRYARGEARDAQRLRDDCAHASSLIDQLEASAGSKP